MEFKQKVPMSRPSGRGLKILLSYLLDYTIIIILFGAVAALNFATPFQQYFALQNYTLHYPYAERERVSDALLYVCSILLPALVIALWTLAIDTLLDNQRARSDGRRRSSYARTAWELNAGILGLLLANAMAFVVTGILKNLVGKPRPDLISRCQPNLSSTGFDELLGPYAGLVNSSICTQTDMSVLNDGFRSFPSGHSSSSFSGLFFLTLYLAGKLQFWDHKGQIWKVFVVLVPAVSASLIASSRIMDARHHPSDVIAGSVLGVVSALIAYRQYFPSITAVDQMGRAYTSRKNLGGELSMPLRGLRRMDKYLDDDEKVRSRSRGVAERQKPPALVLERADPQTEEGAYLGLESTNHTPPTKPGSNGYAPLNNLVSPATNPSPSQSPAHLQPEVVRPSNSDYSYRSPQHRKNKSLPVLSPPAPTFSPKVLPGPPNPDQKAPLPPYAIFPDKSVKVGNRTISKPKDPRDSLSISPLTPEQHRREVTFKQDESQRKRIVSQPLLKAPTPPPHPTSRMSRPAAPSPTRVIRAPQPLPASTHPSYHTADGADAALPSPSHPLIHSSSATSLVVGTIPLSRTDYSPPRIRRKPTRQAKQEVEAQVQRIRDSEFPGSPRFDGPSEAVELQAERSPAGSRRGRSYTNKASLGTANGPGSDVVNRRDKQLPKPPDDYNEGNIESVGSRVGGGFSEHNDTGSRSLQNEPAMTISRDYVPGFRTQNPVSRDGSDGRESIPGYVDEHNDAWSFTHSTLDEKDAGLSSAIYQVRELTELDFDRARNDSFEAEVLQAGRFDGKDEEQGLMHSLRRERNPHGSGESDGPMEGPV